MLDKLFGEEIFPNIQSKPPLLQLEYVSSCPISCYLEEDTNTHLTTTFFQVVLESNKVSPQPPFLQAEQPQFPQLLLIRLLLQTLHQLRCPSLDSLQHLNVSLVVGGPKLNTVFQMQPHQCLADCDGATLQQDHHYTMSLSTSSKRPLNTSRDGDSTTSLGSLFQCLITLSVKKNFLISSLNLPWRNLRPFPLVLSLVTWEKTPTPPLYNLLSVVESDEVSPQPPFLQAKQSQLPQPLLIRLLLQTLHQLPCPSLHTLQYLNIPLVVGGPKLNTVFEVRPHQCRVEGHNHFPSPAGYAIFDTGQDAIGLLGRLGTLLAHIQAAVNQHPQVLLCQAAFQPLFPKPVALHGVAVAQ
ncbi:LOW QUALITY PROTEIN: hypothetical protein QYF61_000035, partial [Mycteria americana]